MLSLLSALLIVLFNASTHALIPLYAVGVFLSFTLSQYGMVRHWYKEHKPGWIRHAVVNAIGGTCTGIVTLVFTVTKFVHGAWIITIIIPVFIKMFQTIHKHYLNVGSQLSLIGADPSAYTTAPLRHTVLIPISGIHKGIVQAMTYAQSISGDVRALYVELDPPTTERMQEEWQRWGRGVPLVVLKSPYRSVVGPLFKYIDELQRSEHEDIITVIVPEFVTSKWWTGLLHNQTAIFIRTALIFKKGVVVTSVRYHLE
ncbi:MAG: hypothetical protein HY074_08775 [Deltaproteobacteria bacterium]|nr:hypothetical protein [Deltaproteobacteria bacterium]